MESYQKFGPHSSNQFETDLRKFVQSLPTPSRSIPSRPVTPPSPCEAGGEPIGFITSPISLTKRNPFTEANSPEEYFDIRERLKLSKLRRSLRYYHEHDKSQFNDTYRKEIEFSHRPARGVFRVDRYSSGEVLGTSVVIGGKHRYSAPPRPEKIVTTKLSPRAHRNLRRAVENSIENLGYFVTLTFSPSHLQPWQKNDNGTVRHDFAKYKLSRFLNTCSIRYKRRGTPLEYIWVSEIQEQTGNIHFHIMWNRFVPIAWMTKYWGQASNSVDVEKIRDARHGCNYIRKYLVKQDDVAIEGNRYGITSGLRQTMKPASFIVDPSEESATGQNPSPLSVLRSLASDIKASGGYVHEFGFCLGVPCRSVTYRAKNGQMRKTRGLPRWLGDTLLDLLLGEVPF